MNWIRKLLAKRKFRRILRELNSRGDDRIRPSDVVGFSEPLRSALNLAIRKGEVSLTEFASMVEFDREEAREIADILVARKLFQRSDKTDGNESYYETRPSAMTRPMKRPPIDLWKKIDE